VLLVAIMGPRLYIPGLLAYLYAKIYAGPEIESFKLGDVSEVIEMNRDHDIEEYERTIRSAYDSRDYDKIVSVSHEYLSSHASLAPETQVYINHHLCVSYYVNGNTERSLQCAKEALTTIKWTKGCDIRTSYAIAVCENYYGLITYYEDDKLGIEIMNASRDKFAYIVGNYYLESEYVDVYYYLGSLLMNTEPGIAIDYLNRFIKKCQDDSNINYLPAHGDLGYSYLVAGMHDNAGDMFAKALKIAKKIGRSIEETYYVYGKYYYEIGDLDNSYMMLSTARKLLSESDKYPSDDILNIECSIALGCVKMAMGHVADAKELLVSTMNNAINDSGIVEWGYLNLGHAYFEYKDYQNAIICYTKVIKSEYASEQYKQEAREYLDYINSALL